MGERVRITAQLIDAATGKHLWAERYDRGMADLFAIHDEIIAIIVSSLSDQIDNATLLRAKTKPPANWQAYDHLLSAIAELISDRFSPAKYQRALDHLESATRIDPNYARAFGLMALCYNRMSLFFCKGNLTEYTRLRTLCQENARQAVALDNNSAEALSVLGWSQIWARKYAEGERYAERAHAVNPNDGTNAMRFVTALIYLGKPGQAVRLAEATIQHTNPYPEWFLADLAEAYFFARRNDDAVAVIEKIPEAEMTEDRAAAICALAYAGKLDSARAHAEQYLAQLRANWMGDPQASVADMLAWEFQYFLPCCRPEDVEYVRDGLRKAGLPA
jgi:tetratricopeptide (TPR) repeat protein